METLLEDYKRRLNTVNIELQTLRIKSQMDVEKKERLETKASCYRTFISELEREIKIKQDL
jgi:hypothetical protein